MHVDLKLIQDVIWMMVLGGIAGGIGGIAQELLIVRRGPTSLGAEGPSDDDARGALEIPKTRWERYWDLGWVASVIIGIVAGIIALWLFSPIEAVQDGDKTLYRYELLSVVGIGLLAGVGGPAFIGLARDRTLALLTAERFQQRFKSVSNQASYLKESADKAREMVGDRSKTNGDLLAVQIQQLSGGIDSLIKSCDGSE